MQLVARKRLLLLGLMTLIWLAQVLHVKSAVTMEQILWLLSEKFTSLSWPAHAAPSAAGARDEDGHLSSAMSPVRLPPHQHDRNQSRPSHQPASNRARGAKDRHSHDGGLHVLGHG